MPLSYTHYRKHTVAHLNLTQPVLPLAAVRAPYNYNVKTPPRHHMSCGAVVAF